MATKTRTGGRKRFPDPEGRAYERAANELARSYCPRLYPCRKCGWPVADGYCCQTCGTGTPYEPGDTTDADD